MSRKRSSPEDNFKNRQITVEEWIALGEEAEEEKPQKEPKSAIRILKRIGIISGISLASIVVLIVSGFLFMFYSPWTTTYRDQYILMTYYTSNPWLCTLFFSQETIDEAFANNGIVEPQEEMDPSLIVINPPSNEGEGDSEGEDVPAPPPFEFKSSEKYGGEIIFEEQDIRITRFTGTTQSGKYTARMMQVKDPSRLFIGVTKYLGDKNNQSGNPGRGQTVTAMCEDNDAFCGINAGGFMDPGGGGSGGIPVGAVVKDGVYSFHGQPTSVHSLIGFTYDNILVICENTKEAAEKNNLRDAVSWRPPSPLVLNGEKVEYKGLAGGFDPRSAIGQCSDGSVLLLVVDGSSLRGIDGANFSLMADIMYEFGAVNAANLDGGTSACMSVDGEVINTVCNPNIAKRGRNLATTWLVRNLPEDAE